MSLFKDPKTTQEEKQINTDLSINKQEETLESNKIKLPGEMVSEKEDHIILDTKSVNKDVVEKIDESEKNLINSYGEVEGEKIKVVEEPKIIDTSRYVSLEKNISINSSEDSGNMQTLKNAIIRYQKSKGSATEELELRMVIAACNAYTRFKFSAFKFGKAAVRLKEVKAVREAAQKELDRINAESLKLTEEEQKERGRTIFNAMKENRELYLPEVKRHNKMAAQLKKQRIKDQKEEDAQKLKEATRKFKAAMKNLKYEYPELSDEEAMNLTAKGIHDNTLSEDHIEKRLIEEDMEELASGALQKHKDNIVKEHVKRLKYIIPALSKEDANEIAKQEIAKNEEYDAIDIIKYFKKDKAKQIKLEQSWKEQAIKIRTKEFLNSYNVVARLFMGTFGYLHVQNLALMDKLTADRFKLGLEEEDDQPKAKTDMDYDSTFI